MKRYIPIRLPLTAVFSLFIACAPLLHAQEAIMKNISVEQKYSIIRISYDLVGSEDEYDVQLRLRKTGEPGYSYQPKHVKGDVGDAVKPGTGKVIEWDVTEEFPEGLAPSEGYRLNFQANYEMGFLRKYSLYLGGGAVATGAAMYFILSGGGTSTPSSSSLPDPYGRPEKW